MKNLVIFAINLLMLFAWSGPSLAQAVTQAVEEIYVLRSWRESRGAPTEFCAEARTRVGPARVEDYFTLRSTATRASDGLITDANVQTVGRLHACFGPTSDPDVSSFYTEGNIGAVTFTGRGECRAVRRDYPEPGLYFMRCSLELSGLPSGYTGGQLTSNTINSRSNIGEKTDPPGYTQASIATVRLWKRR